MLVWLCGVVVVWLCGVVCGVVVWWLWCVGVAVWCGGGVVCSAQGSQTVFQLSRLRPFLAMFFTTVRERAGRNLAFTAKDCEKRCARSEDSRCAALLQ